MTSEVTQADREAAAQVYDARPSDWSAASDQVRRGLHDDTAIVQAFARHRLTAQSGEGRSGAGEDAVAAVVRELYGHDLDPFSEPEKWDFAEKIASAALNARQSGEGERE